MPANINAIVILTFTLFVFIYSAQEQLNLKSNNCDFLLWRTCTLITMSWQICQLLQAWLDWESKPSSISWVNFCWSWCIYLVSLFYSQGSTIFLIHVSLYCCICFIRSKQAQTERDSFLFVTECLICVLFLGITTKWLRTVADLCTENTLF